MASLPDRRLRALPVEQLARGLGLVRVRYYVERWLLRGTSQQLFAVAAVLGLLTFLGAALYRYAAPRPWSEALWWAFLRLTDTGYLGDDQGLGPRLVSTVLTVLGAVVFLGSMVAILSQSLTRMVRTLEAGTTPMRAQHHLVVLGWNSRTAAIARELLLSEDRVQHFLARLGHRRRRLQIAILAEDVDADLRQELRDRVGGPWRESKVTLRSGDPLVVSHLHRVAFARAAAVMIAADDPEGGDVGAVDARLVKTLMSMRNQLAHASATEYPFVAAEVLDAQRAALARRAYGGPMAVLASDLAIGRLFAQAIRHPGTSAVFGEILSHDFGAEVYLRTVLPEWAGPLGEVERRFSRAVVLGFLRSEPGAPGKLSLNPSSDTELAAGDRLVLLADDFSDTDAEDAPRAPAGGSLVDAPACPLSTPSKVRSILMLGFSQKAAALIAELSQRRDPGMRVHVLSSTPVARRLKLLAHYGYRSAGVTLSHTEGDATMASELQALDAAAFDAVVIMGRDYANRREESDARTILSYLVLSEQLRAAKQRPQVLVELLEEGNRALLDTQSDEVLVSPVIVSHMLSQIALRHELEAVFDELMSAGGADLELWPATPFFPQAAPCTFGALVERGRALRVTVLGVRHSDALGRSDTWLAPPAETELVPDPKMNLVVLVG